MAFKTAKRRQPSRQAATRHSRQAAQQHSQATRWRSRVLWILLAVVLVVGVPVGVVFSPLADVERVDIVGLNRLTLDEVESSLNFGPGVALISLDFDAAHNALTELTWFDDASFSRALNGVITVRVTEQRPVALALDVLGNWVVVSHQGRVLTGPLNPPPDLPRVLGIDAAAQTGQFLPEDVEPLIAVVIALEQTSVAHERVWFDDSGDIWLALTTGDRVVLGDGLQLAAKLAALMTLLAELDRLPDESSEQPPATAALEIDVSVPHLPVVRPAVPTTEQSTEQSTGQSTVPEASNSS